MSSYPRRVALAAAVLAAASVLAGCGSDAPAAGGTAATSSYDKASFNLLPASAQKAKAIKVGIAVGASPFATAGQPAATGIIPDLAKEVSSVLGVRMTLVELPYPGLTPAMQAGKVDVVWAVNTDTDLREKTLDFVEYQKTSSGFLVAKGNPTGLRTVSDLCGVKLAAIQGGIYQPTLDAQVAKCSQEGKPALKVSPFGDGTTPLLSVRSGKNDAYIGTTAIIRFYAQKVDRGQHLQFVDARLLPGYLGITTLKGSPYAKALQSALKQVVADGSYARILAKYGAGADALTADQVVIDGVGTGALK